MIFINKCSIGISLCVLMFLMAYACEDTRPEYMDSKGYQLSLKYCSTCHLYTQVELLDRTSWMNVLPQMAKQIEEAGIKLADNEWPEIYSHFINNAPYNLRIPNSEQSYNDSTKNYSTYFMGDTLLASNLTLLECSPSDSNAVIIGNLDGQLFTLKDKIEDDFAVVHPVPVDIDYNIQDSNYLVLSMGFIGPQNTKSGKLQVIDKDGVRTIIDGLARPVHFVTEDLNNDGSEEYIIASFGSTQEPIHSGGLSIYETKNNNIYEHNIGPYTGATKAIVYDFNNDGKKDIIALFSQGDERIMLFENQGDFQFIERTLIRFHPLYGCLDFEIYDFEGDGKSEIILANGDNADYSQILKPYHGVRIFKLDNNLEYNQVYFKHINGASQVILTNIDNDNKKDITILSSYPNLFTTASEFLTVLLNEGNYNFKHAFVDSKPSANWILCAICPNESGQIFLGANNTIIRNIPPSLRAEWFQNHHPIMKYSLD